MNPESPTDIVYNTIDRFSKQKLALQIDDEPDSMVRKSDLILKLTSGQRDITRLPLIASGDLYIENYPVSMAKRQGYMHLTYIMTALWLQQVNKVITSDEPYNTETEMRNFWNKLRNQGLAEQSGGDFFLTLPAAVKGITVLENMPDIEKLTINSKGE